MKEASTVKGALAFVSDSILSPAGKTISTAQAGNKKRHSYKPLPKEFRRGRFDYRQIYREGDFAIYQQTWKGNEHSAAFELIRIRRREGFQIGGRFVEAAEVYPASKLWGTDGFTLTDRDAAFAKLREMTGAKGSKLH